MLLPTMGCFHEGEEEDVKLACYTGHIDTFRTFKLFAAESLLEREKKNSLRLN